MHLKRISLSVMIIAVCSAFFAFYQEKGKDENLPTYIYPIKKAFTQSFVVTGVLGTEKEVAVKSKNSGVIVKTFVQTGDFVNEGDKIALVKVIYDAEEISRKEDLVSKSSIDFNKTKDRFERYSELFLDSLISKDEFEDVKATYLESLNAYESAVKQLEIVKRGFEINENKSNANIIKAGAPGMITSLDVGVGESVQGNTDFGEGTQIALISDMSQLILEASVNEYDLKHLRKGSYVHMNIPALSLDSIKAIVKSIAVKAISKGGVNSFPVIISITDSLLKSTINKVGYTAYGTIEKKEEILKIAVPFHTIHYDTKGDPYVFKYMNHEKVKQQVELGIADDQFIEIKQGINLNDTLTNDALY